jgi:tRNA A37 threonylcarbamoyladenosine dehydratase
LKLPWRNNERLIRALYDKIQALKGEMTSIQNGIEVSKIITDMKKEITKSVLDSFTEQVISDTVDRIIKAIDAKKAKAGLV